MLAMENVRYAAEAGTILQPPFESVKDLLGRRMRTQVWASVALRAEQFTALSQLLYARFCRTIRQFDDALRTLGLMTYIAFGLARHTFQSN
jgi:hypothetical protein